MRKLASIVRIATCEPIKNTDRLSVATMEGNGWKVVTARDEFKTGDLAVYFEIDAALPFADERYAFLRDRCGRKFCSKSGQLLEHVIRIKTAKLRGVISQGLLMPLDRFPEVTDQIIASDEGDMFINSEGNPVPVIGADLTDLLDVRHYDELKAALAPEMGVASIPCDAKMSDFPTAFCPKSDEERIQGLTSYFTTMSGRKFEVTEKRDGSSCSFGYCPSIDAEIPFMVCSRNMRLKQVSGSGTVPPMWKLVNELGLEEKCKRHPDWMFQAEFCAPGVNGNRDRLTAPTLEVFRIYDVAKQAFVEASIRRDICYECSIPHVPVIEESLDVFSVYHNIEDLLEYADGSTARGNPREGLVFKETGTTHPVSFKAVSNKYLMNEAD